MQQTPRRKSTHVIFQAATGSSFGKTSVLDIGSGTLLVARTCNEKSRTDTIWMVDRLYHQQRAIVIRKILSDLQQG